MFFTAGLRQLKSRRQKQRRRVGGQRGKMQKETYREINEELKRIGSRGYAGGMKMKLELETHRKRK